MTLESQGYVATPGHLSSCLAPAGHCVDSRCRALAGIGIFQELPDQGRDPDPQQGHLGNNTCGRGGARPQRPRSENSPSGAEDVCSQADENSRFSLCLGFPGRKRGNRLQVLWGGFESGPLALPAPHYPVSSSLGGAGSRETRVQSSLWGLGQGSLCLVSPP